MAKLDPRRDAAGVGPYARERERLVPLSTLSGWDVTGDGADIRSWEVKTLSGKLLGHVREMLVDPVAKEVVMIDVDLTGTDRHAYLPLRVAEIDRTNRVVRADSGDMEEHTAGSHEATRPIERIDDAGSGASERIIERRPMVEETVVRRRDAAEPDVQP